MRCWCRIFSASATFTGGMGGKKKYKFKKKLKGSSYKILILIKCSRKMDSADIMVIPATEMLRKYIFIAPLSIICRSFCNPCQQIPDKKETLCCVLKL